VTSLQEKARLPNGGMLLRFGPQELAARCTRSIVAARLVDDPRPDPVAILPRYLGFALSSEPHEIDALLVNQLHVDGQPQLVSESGIPARFFLKEDMPPLLCSPARRADQILLTLTNFTDSPVTAHAVLDCLVKW
jgi:hypothetical protein